MIEKKTGKAQNRKQLAHSLGLDSEWFAQLAKQISMSEMRLRTLMKDFRASNFISDELRQSYPTERGIELFGAAFPQTHTIDFVLSFLNFFVQKTGQVISQEQVTFLKFGNAVVEQAKRRHVLAVTKTLDAEDLRRKKYWVDRQSYVEKVLCGTYILFRPSLTLSGDKSFDRVYTEVLHIKKNKKFPQVLNAYWRRWTQRRKIFYIGNFFTSSNFMYGTFVNRSSDEILKPINICILSKHASRTGIRHFVLTGSLTGTDVNQEKIVHYPIALRRLRPEELPETGDFDGVDKITQSNFVEFADAVLNSTHAEFHTQEMIDFIKTNHTEIGSLDLNLRKR